MKMIDNSFVRRINDILIEQDIPIGDRPLETALIWMEENKILGQYVDRDSYEVVEKIYKEIYPYEDFSLAVLKGCVAIQDKIYKVNIPICYGTVQIHILALIEIDMNELQNIFQNHPEQGWRAYYAVGDLLDYGFGIDDLRFIKDEGSQLLEQATNNLIATGRILLQYENVDVVVQTACITAELSMKAVLAKFGYDEKSRRSLGHNLENLAKEIVKMKTMDSDDRFLYECGCFPDYVQNRYSPSGLSRKQLMNLAMRAQFVAAESVRRITDRNLVKEMESDPCNLERPDFDL